MGATASSSGVELLPKGFCQSADPGAGQWRPPRERNVPEGGLGGSFICVLQSGSHLSLTIHPVPEFKGSPPGGVHETPSLIAATGIMAQQLVEWNMLRATTQPSLPGKPLLDSSRLHRGGGWTALAVLALFLTSTLLLWVGPNAPAFQSHAEPAMAPSTGDSLARILSNQFDPGAKDVFGVPYSPCTLVRNGVPSSCGTNLPLPSNGASLPADIWWNETGRAGGNPPMVVWASMALDPAADEVVFFGGLSGSHILNQTWTYENGTWKNITATQRSAPPPVFGAGMTYDPTVRALLLFGGCTDVTCSTQSSSLWEFLAGSWTQLQPPLSPPGLAWTSFSYDPADQEDLLVGGYECTGTSACTAGGHAYLYNATTTLWTSLSSTGAPPARWGASLAWDPLYNQSSGALLLFGGANSTAVSNQSYWYVANSSTPWVPLRRPVAPSPREFPSLTYDSRDRALLLYGGQECAGISLCPNATDTTWTLNSSWSWDNLTLSVGTPPTAQVGSQMAQDPSGKFVDLIGGANRSGAAQNVTWWFFPRLQVGPTTASPSALDVNNTLRLNVTAIFGVLPYTFHWVDLPKPCLSNSSDQLSCTPNATGAYSIWVNVTDFANETVSSLPVRVVIHPPLGIVANVSPPVTTVGHPVEFNATIHNGTPPFQVLWTFGNLLESHVANVTTYYNRTGSYTATLLVNDSGGESRELKVSIQVEPALSLQASVTPSTVTVGQAVSLSASASGGVLPINITWEVNGHMVGWGAVVSYTPPVAGTYSVTAVARDSIGDRAYSNGSFEAIFPTPPSFAAIISSNVTNTTVDSNVTITLSIPGGSVSNYTEVWALNGSNTTHRGGFWIVSFPHAGNYTVSAWVTSPQGRTESTNSVVIRVLPVLNLAGSSPGSSNYWPWLLVLAAAAAVAAGVGAYIWNQRRGSLGLTSHGAAAQIIEWPGPLPNWQNRPLVILEGSDPLILYSFARQCQLEPERILLLAPESTPDVEAAISKKGIIRWRISRLGAEGSLHPADADRIGSVIELHFRRFKGSVVVLGGLDAILEATNLKTVRRLVQVSREVALETQGTLVTYLNPSGFGPQERVRIEEDAYILRVTARRFLRK